jgi:hypothetical protein
MEKLELGAASAMLRVIEVGVVAGGAVDGADGLAAGCEFLGQAFQEVQDEWQHARHACAAVRQLAGGLSEGPPHAPHALSKTPPFEPPFEQHASHAGNQEMASEGGTAVHSAKHDPVNPAQQAYKDTEMDVAGVLLQRAECLAATLAAVAEHCLEVRAGSSRNQHRTLRAALAAIPLWLSMVPSEARESVLASLLRARMRVSALPFDTYRDSTQHSRHPCPWSDIKPQPQRNVDPDCHSDSHPQTLAHLSQSPLVPEQNSQQDSSAALVRHAWDVQTQLLCTANSRTRLLAASLATAVLRTTDTLEPQGQKLLKAHRSSGVHALLCTAANGVKVTLTRKDLKRIARMMHALCGELQATIASDFGETQPTLPPKAVLHGLAEVRTVLSLLRAEVRSSPHNASLAATLVATAAALGSRVSVVLRVVGVREVVEATEAAFSASTVLLPLLCPAAAAELALSSAGAALLCHMHEMLRLVCSLSNEVSCRLTSAEASLVRELWLGWSRKPKALRIKQAEALRGLLFKAAAGTQQQCELQTKQLSEALPGGAHSGVPPPNLSKHQRVPDKHGKSKAGDSHTATDLKHTSWPEDGVNGPACRHGATANGPSTLGVGYVSGMYPGLHQQPLVLHALSKGLLERLQVRSGSSKITAAKASKATKKSQLPKFALESRDQLGELVDSTVRELASSRRGLREAAVALQISLQQAMHTRCKSSEGDDLLFRNVLRTAANTLGHVRVAHACAAVAALEMFGTGDTGKGEEVHSEEAREVAQFIEVRSRQVLS